MNILLSESSTPATIGGPASSAADHPGDRPDGQGEFALLLHQEITADPEALPQKTDFTSVSVFEGQTLAIQGDGLGGSAAALTDWGGIIDQSSLDRLATAAAGTPGMLAADASSVAAALTAGGNILPPPASMLPAGALASADVRALADASGAGLPPGPGPASGASAPSAVDAQAWPGVMSLPLGPAGPMSALSAPPGTGLEPDLNRQLAAELPLPRIDIHAVDAAAARSAEGGMAAIAAMPDARPVGALGAVVAPGPLPAGSSREWGEALNERIHWMVDRQQSSATLRLDPPTLGRLDVQLRVSDDATTITIQTQHAQVRDLIDAAAPRLRELLQENGYQNVNVDVSQHSDQADGEARQMADGEHDESPDDARDEPLAGSRGAADESAGHRLLDTFA